MRNVSELVKANEEEIKELIASEWESVIRCNGSIETQIYIWSDGELETLTDCSGSNTWLKAKDCESRTLHHVCTISCNAGIEDMVDPHDQLYIDDQDAYMANLVDWYIGEYKGAETDRIYEEAIERIEEEEKWQM